MDAQVQFLQDRIAYCFQRHELLLEALTHRSFIAEYDSAVPDNQRLEFLGDAVIEIIVTDKIYRAYPEMPEGRMTKLRAAITRQPTLVALARRLRLGDCLRLGRGEDRSGGRERPSNLCDAFEALTAALYLDAGHQLAEPARFLNALIDELYPDLEAALEDDNPKGTLQEWAQQHRDDKPDYAVVEISGPDHERDFNVEVRIGERVYGSGRAGRRQAAEEIAAREALARIRQEAAAARAQQAAAQVPQPEAGMAPPAAT